MASYIMLYIDNKFMLGVESTYIDRVKGYLIINFRKKLPHLSRWKPHIVTFWLYISDGDNKKLAEFMVKGIKKRKQSLYLKLDNSTMEKWYV